MTLNKEEKEIIDTRFKWYKGVLYKSKDDEKKLLEWRDQVDPDGSVLKSIKMASLPGGMMARTLIFALMVCTMTPFAGCAVNSGTSKVHREGAYFEVAVPAGWTQVTQDIGLSQEEKKVYGITLTGPASAEGRGSAPRLSALYYAPDNLLDKDPVKFINIHTTEAPGNGAPFPDLPKVDEGKVGGLPTEVFANVTSERGAERRIGSKGTVVWESFAVIPLKNGYYVLRYTAPANKYNGRLKVFEAFIASFKPLLK